MKCQQTAGTLSETPDKGVLPFIDQFIEQISHGGVLFNLQLNYNLQYVIHLYLK